MESSFSQFRENLGKNTSNSKFYSYLEEKKFAWVWRGTGLQIWKTKVKKKKYFEKTE
jgi:hypothetical protein